MEFKIILDQWELSLVTSIVHIPGVLDEPSLVFQGFPEEVLTEQDRVLSVTCVEVGECLPQRRLTVGGTGKSTRRRSAKRLLLV